MKLKKFDVLDFLKSDEDLVMYLNIALEERDPHFFIKALGDVARAKGMTSVAKASGLGRQALYRSLSSNGNPRIDTLFKVLDTLNVRLLLPSSVAIMARRSVGGFDPKAGGPARHSHSSP